MTVTTLLLDLENPDSESELAILPIFYASTFKKVLSGHLGMCRSQSLRSFENRDEPDINKIFDKELKVYQFSLKVPDSPRFYSSHTQNGNT